MSEIKGTIKEFDDSVITINIKATETYKNLQQRINKAIKINKKIYDLVAFGDSENQLSELVYNLSEILKGDK